MFIFGVTVVLYLYPLDLYYSFKLFTFYNTSDSI